MLLKYKNQLSSIACCLFSEIAKNEKLAKIKNVRDIIMNFWLNIFLSRNYLTDLSFGKNRQAIAFVNFRKV